jgi:hypothetical protein
MQKCEKLIAEATSCTRAIAQGHQFKGCNLQVGKFNILANSRMFICVVTSCSGWWNADKICMMMTRLACNRAIESSYWRMDSDPDVGLLTSYVLYRLPVELEFMDLDTFPR